MKQKERIVAWASCPSPLASLRKWRMRSGEGDFSESFADVRDSFPEVSGSSGDISESSVDIPDSSVDIPESSVDINGSSVDIPDSSVDIPESSIARASCPSATGARCPSHPKWHRHSCLWDTSFAQTGMSVLLGQDAQATKEAV